MTKVEVKASKNYDVLIESGILERCGQYIKNYTKKTAVIISDDIVFPLYGEKTVKSLESEGIAVKTFVFPHGEESKSLKTYGEILQFLCDERVSNSDVLVALGGGVVGDITGFAASTYHRGITFVQLPTTLLAAVDSSVGGKTAIDLEGGKNQAGCFYQPSIVLCDPSVFSTLPECEYLCGCAEIIKYAVLGSEKLFCEIENTPVSLISEYVVGECVKMKRDIVGMDEFDNGVRQKLNLGHTVGHAIEACSNFGVSHGMAVAKGMAVIALAALNLDYCTSETYNRIISILIKYGFDISVDFPAVELFEAMCKDKKVNGGKVNFIVPKKIGFCDIVGVSTEDIPKWLENGGIK